jgi:hypothetical protein
LHKVVEFGDVEEAYLSLLQDCFRAVNGAVTSSPARSEDTGNETRENEGGHDSDEDGSDENFGPDDEEQWRADTIIEIPREGGQEDMLAKALFDTGASRNVISEEKRRICAVRGRKAPTPLKVKLGDGRLIKVQRYCRLDWAPRGFGKVMQSRFWILENPPYEVIIGRRDIFQHDIFTNNLDKTHLTPYIIDNDGKSEFPIWRVLGLKANNPDLEAVSTDSKSKYRLSTYCV